MTHAAHAIEDACSELDHDGNTAIEYMVWVKWNAGQTIKFQLMCSVFHLDSPDPYP